MVWPPLEFLRLDRRLGPTPKRVRPDLSREYCVAGFLDCGGAGEVHGVYGEYPKLCGHWRAFDLDMLGILASDRHDDADPDVETE